MLLWLALYVLLGAGVAKVITPTIIRVVGANEEVKAAGNTMQHWEFYLRGVVFWPIALCLFLVVRKDGLNK